MKIHYMEQRSDEWFRIRAGKFTGSILDDIVPCRDPEKLSGTQRKICYKIAAERITGVPISDGYSSAAMQWGIDHESSALAALEMEIGKTVETVGFCELDEWVGCSPDGLATNMEFGIEIKCPNTNTHLRYLMEGFGSDYKYQVQGAMMVTGTSLWYLASYDPRILNNQLVVEIVNRDEEYIRMIRQRLDVAKTETQKIIERALK